MLKTYLPGKGMNSRKYNEEKTEKKRQPFRRRRFPARKPFSTVVESLVWSGISA